MRMNKVLSCTENYLLQSVTSSGSSYQIRKQLRLIIFYQSGCISRSEGCDEQESLQTKQEQQEIFVHGWSTDEFQTLSCFIYCTDCQPTTCMWTKRKQQQDTNDFTHYQTDVREKLKLKSLWCFKEVEKTPRNLSRTVWWQQLTLGCK